MRFEYGSAYDDDAANEGRPAHEVEAERRRDMALAHGAGTRSVSEAARLVYLRYSPDSSSRQVLLLLGKRNWGSLDFDVCPRCRRAHIWSLTLPAVMKGEGFEARMVRIALAKVPDDHRWTLGGMAGEAQRFWPGGTRPVRAREPDELCEHLKRRQPGKLRDLWARVRYWRLTGQLHWPDWL
ncbi:hypothetical protein [Actinomadura rudentiformis]|uniref:Uncharacterized protein n=1 Tax=Actinomadura rudentiformis TaxID=359158 RepID=A0A6H9YY58_9ACTN|nr:hypothetical protein [Actinomadura rudentiformis]KAB2345184.1 hypothetical protein F8566_28360 [Actinomadura rudentiformis]